ncbi:MAG: MBL fold metallo-hydrolase [Bryobacteraceae bacterium]
MVPIREGAHLVKGGSGANTGFIVGEKEVIVIDAKMTEASAREMLAEIGKLTPNPVRTLILTHSDGDHVNGLPGFPQGLRILAHANTRKDMEAAINAQNLTELTPYLPNETLTESRKLTIGGVPMELLYFGPGHTSGDLIVLLLRQKIAFAGDLLFVGRDPLIHQQKSGSSTGLVNVLRRMLALDADTFVSGHADPLTKTDIQALLANIEAKQAKVKELVGQGQTLEQIKNAMGETAAAGGRFPTLVDVIYLELTAKP